MDRRRWLIPVLFLAVMSACSTPLPDNEAITSTTPSPTPLVNEPDAPAIVVEPVSSLADEIVKIEVMGLAPKQEVVLTASLRDDFRQVWRSQATFLADEQGVVNVATQTPLAGSYQTADPMGLFWSMQPDEAQAFFVNFRSTFIPVEIAAHVAGEQVAVAYANRQRMNAEVSEVEVNEAGLIGRFYAPSGTTPRPALLVLGGSGGGVDTQKGMMLASHGYATLALDYFGDPPLPESLTEIPLEYFETALSWLKKQEGVDAERLGVVGTSRGGELALLLAATFPDLKVVVGYVPSGVVFGNLARDSVGEKSAWTYRGEPITFGIWSNPELIKRAIIPVEQINGAVLLISAKDDQIWPSTRLSEIAISQLAEHGHPHPYTHLHYENAGHLIDVPFWPTTMNEITDPMTGARLVFGGTAQGTALASTDSWRQVLAFLAQNFGEQ
ncbi:MAG: acyl-CoA thioesterase/bile acid-CoA:amino acid N-acyltransferase family protein [Chloroflexota bacterium]